MKTPYSPEQNAVAERDNRMLVECAGSMLYHKQIPLLFRGEDINTVVYVLNRVASITIHGLINTIAKVKWCCTRHWLISRIWKSLLWSLYQSECNRSSTPRHVNAFLWVIVTRRRLNAYGVSRNKRSLSHAMLFSTRTPCSVHNPLRLHWDQIIRVLFFRRH